MERPNIAAMEINFDSESDAAVLIEKGVDGKEYESSQPQLGLYSLPTSKSRAELLDDPLHPEFIPPEGKLASCWANIPAAVEGALKNSYQCSHAQCTMHRSIQWHSEGPVFNSSLRFFLICKLPTYLSTSRISWTNILFLNAQGARD